MRTRIKLVYKGIAPCRVMIPSRLSITLNIYSGDTFIVTREGIDIVLSKLGGI